MRHFLRRPGIKRQSRIVCLAIRQVVLAQILVGNRRKEHDARSGLAVVLLLPGMLHQLGKILFKIGNAILTRKGFIVAKEHEHHIALHLCEPLVGVAKVG